MKKILTVAALVLGCICASAQIGPNPSIPNDPVDYSRLRLPTNEPAYPAFYTITFEKEDDFERLMWFMGEREAKEAFAIDKLSLVGTLVHTWDITPEFVEACIQKALRVSKIGTRRELARLYEVTPEFKDFTYTDEQFGSDMFGFVTGALGFVVPGGPIAEAIYGAVTGTGGLLISNSINHADNLDNALGTAGTLSAVAQGGALQDAVQSGTAVAELSDAGAGSVASGIGNVLTAISMLKLMWDQKQRDNQKWANRVHLMNMCRIDYFYNLVNKYLREDNDDPDKVWVLGFPQIDMTLPFQFRGVMCSANWHISLGALRLNYLEDFNTYDFEGHYYGYFNADVSFDLSKYDSSFIQNVTYEELLGAKGKSNVFINSMESQKGMLAAGDLRYDLNFYKALPGHSVYGIINSGTNLKMSYRSPIHIRVEAPVVVQTEEDKYIEKAPDYFWDFYEDKYTESSLRLSSVMSAMGINIGGRDADVKYDCTLHKAFSAVDNLTKVRVTEEEEMYGDVAIFRSSDGEKTTETKIPMKEMLDNFDIPVTIPAGMARIVWTSEIVPPPTDAKKAAEDKWKEMFQKYGITSNLR